MLPIFLKQNFGRFNLHKFAVKTGRNAACVLGKIVWAVTASEPRSFWSLNRAKRCPFFLRRNFFRTFDLYIFVSQQGEMLPIFLWDFLGSGAFCYFGCKTVNRIQMLPVLFCEIFFVAVWKLEQFHLCNFRWQAGRNAAPFFWDNFGGSGVTFCNFLMRNFFCGSGALCNFGCKTGRNTARFLCLTEIFFWAVPSLQFSISNRTNSNAAHFSVRYFLWLFHLWDFEMLPILFWEMFKQFWRPVLLCNYQCQTGRNAVHFSETISCGRLSLATFDVKQGETLPIYPRSFLGGGSPWQFKCSTFFWENHTGRNAAHFSETMFIRTIAHSLASNVRSCC